MGHSEYDDASRERAAWNAGKKSGYEASAYAEADLG